LFLFTKESNIFSIDWRKEKGRENINCFVLFLYIFNSQIGQNFGQNPPNIFFGFFGQLLALFLAKYISDSIDYVIITEE
jgi:hypothetical protein